MTYLVDTDYVIDYLKGQRNVPEMLNTLLPEGLAVSIISVAEIYEGIYRVSGKVWWCLSRLRQWSHFLSTNHGFQSQF